MNHRYINTIVAFLIIVLAFGALIWQRFDVEDHQTATANGQEYRIGEVISSGEDVTKVSFGKSTIWLDKNTEVKIIDGREDRETVNVVQGRVVIEGPLSVKTREVLTSIDGTASFVHYSWENRIEVAAIDGMPVMTFDDQEIAVEDAVSLYTLPPYELVDIDFVPEESSAAEFYLRWSQNVH